MSDEPRTPNDARSIEATCYDSSPIVIGPSCNPGENGFCATCADEALPARVISIDMANQIALVELNHATGEVDIRLVDDLAPNDVVLIHDGVAIAKAPEA